MITNKFQLDVNVKKNLKCHCGNLFLRKLCHGKGPLHVF